MTEAFCANEANQKKMPCLQGQLRNHDLPIEERTALLEKMRENSKNRMGDMRSEREEMFAAWCGAEDGEKAKDENSVCKMYFNSRRKSEL